VIPYVNETTLFQFQWGYRRKGKAIAPYQEFIKKKVRPIFHDLAKQCAKEKIVECKAAYGYWRCIPDGDALALLDPKDESKEIARFAVPRQAAKQQRCLSDFFAVHDGKPDTVALMVVTVGQNASDVSREWFAANRYQDYLHLHGLSVEIAEGSRSTSTSRSAASSGSRRRRARDEGALQARATAAAASASATRVPEPRRPGDPARPARARRSSGSR
jgi:5-methyltetrahydrofolate--homocysteine methyltransferase